MISATLILDISIACVGVTGRGQWLSCTYTEHMHVRWTGSYSTKLSSEEGSLIEDRYISSVTHICLKVLRASAEDVIRSVLEFFHPPVG